MDFACEKPFYRWGNAFGCGRCVLCARKVARIWALRCRLEYVVSGGGCFVTLTYRDDPGEVSKRDFQLWLKKLRHFREVRYFGCGEYGDRGGRPHYHALLFGRGMDAGNMLEAVERSWTSGFVSVGDVNGATCAYVFGYVAKKLGAVQLAGRAPEFRLMSRRPGLGAGFAKHIASNLPAGVVPQVISVGDDRYAMGRFLRGKVADAAGLKLDGSDFLSEQREWLRDLWLASGEVSASAVVAGISAQRAINERARLALKKGDL